MFTYTIHFRKKKDNVAPSIVSLDDYDEVGKIDAPSIKSLIHVLNTLSAEDSPLSETRALRIGDVVELGGKHWILTPNNVWASVLTV